MKSWEQEMRIQPEPGREMWPNTIAVSLICMLATMPVVTQSDPQVWDVERLIRARNPGASFTTTERPNTTWTPLRSITYNPLLEAGSVGSASVEEASLVRRVKPSRDRSESGAGEVNFSQCFLLLCLSSFIWMRGLRWTFLGQWWWEPWGSGMRTGCGGDTEDRRLVNIMTVGSDVKTVRSMGVSERWSDCQITTYSCEEISF